MCGLSTQCPHGSGARESSSQPAFWVRLTLSRFDSHGPRWHVLKPCPHATWPFTLHALWDVCPIMLTQTRIRGLQSESMAAPDGTLDPELVHCLWRAREQTFPSLPAVTSVPQPLVSASSGEAGTAG